LAQAINPLIFDFSGHLPAQGYLEDAGLGRRHSTDRINMNIREAPDFTLIDTQGRAVSLSSYRGKKHVVLVFNRGFA
jgi:hypothetical protein